MVEKAALCIKGYAEIRAIVAGGETTDFPLSFN
jgi:hypothetical protein